MPEATKPKKYANGIYVRKHEFTNGGHVFNISIRREQFIAWMNEHAPAGDDFVRLTMGEKRDPDKYGTHSVWLDEFNRSPSRRNDEAKPETVEIGGDTKPDDLPF